MQSEAPQNLSSWITTRTFLAGLTFTIGSRLIEGISHAWESQKTNEKMEIIFQECCDGVREAALKAEQVSLNALMIKLQKILHEKHFNQYDAKSLPDEVPCNIVLCHLSPWEDGTECMVCETTLLGQKYSRKIIVPAGTLKWRDGSERNISSLERAQIMHIQMRAEYLAYIKGKIQILLQGETDTRGIQVKLEKLFLEEKGTFEKFGFSFWGNLSAWRKLNPKEKGKIFIFIDFYDSVRRVTQTLSFDSWLREDTEVKKEERAEK